MSLAVTSRCLISTEIRHLKKINQRMPHLESRTASSAKDILELQKIRSYKHSAIRIVRKVSSSGDSNFGNLQPPPKPFTHPVATQNAGQPAVAENTAPSQPAATSEKTLSPSAIQSAVMSNPAAAVSTDSNPESSNYSVCPGCLAPFIDSRHWYAGNKLPEVVMKDDNIEKLPRTESVLIKQALMHRERKTREPKVEEIRSLEKVDKERRL